MLGCLRYKVLLAQCLGCGILGFLVEIVVVVLCVGDLHCGV